MFSIGKILMIVGISIIICISIVSVSVEKNDILRYKIEGCNFLGTAKNIYTVGFYDCNGKVEFRILK